MTVPRHVSRILAALILLFSINASAWGDDREDGWAAFNQGDYATAIHFWKPLAERGDAEAQNNLGVMYDNGYGVPQDSTEAVKWYRLAAEQGHASSQFNLGLMYYNGQGVPQDYVQAHKWWNLAAAQGDEDAVTNRDIVARRMTPSQIEEAQRLASEWLAAHPQ